MNLTQLRTFVAIAEAESFVRARGLYLSQPAASRQIQALEASLGVLLFDRLGRRIKLTPEGEDLLHRGRRLLQEAESFAERARALKGGQAGTLRVGGSTQHIESVLADFLPRFKLNHPEVDVDLVEEGGARVPERLERGDVHLALMTSGDDAYSYKLLAPVLVLAVVPATHALARRTTLEISELTDHPLLLLRRDYASRGWFDAACHEAHIKPKVLLESAAPHTLLALARTGRGIALVPSNVSIAQDAVQALPLVRRRTPIGRWAIAAWDSRRFLPPYGKLFIDDLVAFCRDHYPGRDLLRRTSPLPRPRRASVPG